jgi:hypothetical protein
MLFCGNSDLSYSLLILLFLMFEYRLKVNWISSHWRKLASTIVSVPGGAPGKVSTKELPSFEKVCTDTKILWSLLLLFYANSYPEFFFSCVIYFIIYIFLCNRYVNTHQKIGINIIWYIKCKTADVL